MGKMKVNRSVKLTALVMRLDDQPDSKGDTFLPGCLERMPKTVPLVWNFNHHRVLGEASIYIDPNLNRSVMAEISLAPNALPNGLVAVWPCIGGHIVKHSDDGVARRKIESFNINSVSLCSNPNTDHAIQPISVKDWKQGRESRHLKYADDKAIRKERELLREAE